jgi:hypothetical protein
MIIILESKVKYMKNEFYIECILIHNNDRILTTWLPEKFAVKDKMICLKGDNG